jgi:hypothetical protein
MFSQHFLIKIIKKRCKTFFLLNYLIKNVFAMFFVKIIKNILRKMFFLLNYLIKNVFATFFVKTIKNVCEKRFFLLNY